MGDVDDVVDASWVTVVGVIPSIYQGEFEEAVGPQTYRPVAQETRRFYSLFVRTMDGDITAAAALMREEERRIDPDLPIYWVVPLQSHLDDALFLRNF